ncbi:MAG: MBL fold metallo-hydrolase [Chitinophagales bacterium]|nr:MBL fold metallo-hydrolase [Chitinophagales bacterium]
MSLFVTSLNSGSNGNCYYIGNHDEAVLIDAGLSCRETERRMKRLGLSMHKVKAIFITHEHTDHIYGVSRLSKKYQLPVYITEGTRNNHRLHFQQHLPVSFQPYKPIEVGSLTVTAFPKFHDAADPHSFLVAGNGVQVGVFTDIGRPCEHLIAHFKQCDAAFLESNYDEEMLETGGYPQRLKDRIRGGSGHLSNTQALALFTRHRSAQLTHLFLSHLSANNNCPRLAQDMFNAVAGKTEIILAPRTQETAVYHITNAPIRLGRAVKSKVAEEQLSLF